MCAIAGTVKFVPFKRGANSEVVVNTDAGSSTSDEIHEQLSMQGVLKPDTDTNLYRFTKTETKVREDLNPTI